MEKKHSIVLLMADDDKEDREFAERALKKARLCNTIMFVCDGEELMDYLKRRGKYKDPKLSPVPGVILLDLNMPKKDGREALKEIKADPALKEIPVVILTTSDDDVDVRSAYDLGANSYITKPVNMDGMVKV
ncbi:MAG: response regulator, partial [Thermodesulfobacteriota bacterium]